ncbi:aldo/keto reductase [Pollutibacter soli]|uniref:aldo/keto reductase n=1 Tax=Pollutibacter soli TaxID=3034157 RepID=UPI0030138B3F
MEYQLLGNSDLNISRIGFGGMSLKSVQHDEAITLLQSAFQQGINFFDTADMYEHGRNEEIIGKAFRDIRDKVIIATKVGNQWRADGSGWDWNPRKDYILKCVDDSLKRLQTDYIDLYQLHGGMITDSRDEVVDAFEQLRKEGKIRYYGISSIRPNVIRAYMQENRNIKSVMLQYSLADRRPEEEVLDTLLQHNIGVLVRGALAQGLLAGKPAKEYLDHSTESIRIAFEAISSISGPHRSTAQTAIRFVLRHPAVASSVIGVRNTVQLKDAIEVFDTPELAEEDYSYLKQSIRQNTYSDHR